MQSAAKPEVTPRQGEIVNRFDYTIITDPEVGAAVRKLATRKANLRQEKTLRLDTGNALLEAKNVKGFGLFDKWLDQEFQFSKRAADNYMALAREFGGTYDLVSYLPSQTLYKLAEGKNLKKVRAEVVEKAQAGTPLLKNEVQSRIAEAAKAMSKGKPASKLGAGDDAKARLDAARSAVDLLREKLEDDFPKFVTWFHDASDAFSLILQNEARAIDDQQKEAA